MVNNVAFLGFWIRPCLSGHVSKLNSGVWARAQPHEHQYRPLSVEKVTVWWALGHNQALLVRGW